MCYKLAPACSKEEAHANKLLTNYKHKLQGKRENQYYQECMGECEM